MKIKTSLILFLLFISNNSAIFSQDLLDKLENEFPDKPIYEIATFKTTRIAMLQSVETRKKGALEISIYNRYWNTPTLTSQSFLADKVSRRFGLNYSFSDNFTFGLGYTNFDNITDGFFKYKILKQQQSSSKMPVTFTFLQNFSHRNDTNAPPAIFGTDLNENVFAYATQLLVARKINQHLSIQVAPTLVGRFVNNTTDNPNTQFAVVAGGRYKISGHASVVAEYYYIANTLKAPKTYQPFLVGLNWEVSDLMLQFHVTNARNFAEDTYIPQTTNNFNFKDPNLHFGFNMTLLLHTKKKKLK